MSHTNQQALREWYISTRAHGNHSSLHAFEHEHKGVEKDKKHHHKHNGFGKKSAKKHEDSMGEDDDEVKTNKKGDKKDGKVTIHVNV